MGGFKPWHILILLLVVLLIFGAGKLPSLARNVGKSMRIFKSEVDELRGDEKPGDEDDDEDDRRRRPAARDDRAAGRPADTSRDRAYDPADQADRVPVRDEEPYRRD